MRTKLTASHPRPSSTDRTPVRPGAPRKPRPRPEPNTGAPQGAAPTGNAEAKRASAPRPPRATSEPSARKPYAGKNEDRPRAPYAGSNEDRPRKPYAGKNEDRPRAPYTGSNEDRPRKPYAGKSEDRPRAPYAGSNEDRPRKPYAVKSDDRSGAPRPARPGGHSGPSGALEKRAPYTPRNTPKPAPREGDAERRLAFRSDDTGRPQRRDAARRDTTKEPGARTWDRSNDTQRPNHAGKGGFAAKTERTAKPGAPRNAGRPAAPLTSTTSGAAPATRSKDSNTSATPIVSTPREDDGTMRLSKRMSELGLCSRREADEWIEKGWVRVDGERVDTLGIRVRPEQQIEVIRQAREQQNRLVTILLHKPVGHVSGQPEDGHPPAAALILPDNRWIHDASRNKFAHVHLRALAPAGRLDIDSTGLLVFTQDGRVAKQLIGESSEIEKEYLVRVSYGSITENVQQHLPASKLALMQHGLSLDGVALRPAEVQWQNPEQLRFVLREGKKRQIRRMCELVGLEVVGLKRVRIGQVMLGSLPVGEWRYMAENEVF